jgi:D-3-phosphoglycerate dehydrogenase
MTEIVKKYSLSKDRIKVLLLEAMHENAPKFFEDNEYTNVEYVKNALDKDELIEKIKDAHLLGIRSRTNITSEVLEHANKLIAIGCYSIGTNQVNLQAAKLKGIPVFNAPFSNTRSVAELVISECIILLRRIVEKSNAAHKGEWLKDAKASYEVRGKNIGIIGYGHIGSQVSILAESLGMNVYYYDIENKLSLGNATVTESLDELLAISDVVTLHVPETELTKNMISGEQLNKMKQGSVLINASRGSVVIIEDLAESLKAKHLAGAAVDVFPKEPATNNEKFINVLQNIPNVIITPHIGGSTAEAQANIALEVSEKLVKYSNVGTTIGATNFVEISLPSNTDKKRFLHIHENKPGILNDINKIFSDKSINVAAQYLQTDSHIGYVIVDVDQKESTGDLISALKSITGTIRARVLI